VEACGDEISAVVSRNRETERVDVYLIEVQTRKRRQKSKPSITALSKCGRSL